MYGYRSRTGYHSGRYTAARLVSGVGAVVAVIEVFYILLILLKANQDNGVFRFVKQLAEPLALFFPGLFTFDHPNTTLVVNYGLAAVFWLVVTGLVARLLA
ncbi:MAG: hypothetical protein HOQ24_00110 [Mycobacteriaceae bacterium]|nr:hypothetical protein [Mycobacteriaceae bacterium]